MLTIAPKVVRPRPGNPLFELNRNSATAHARAVAARASRAG